MKNIELFKNQFYQLPKHYDGDFSLFVRESLNLYLSKLDKFETWLKEEIQENKVKIEALCNAINESIDQYLKGLPAKAYSTLKASLEEIKPYLLYPTKESILLVGGNINNYFRMRESFTKIDKSGIFHIPFYKRQNTLSYRYSIPGIPCIYLSNSVFLCWEELGKPANKRLYCSRFEIDKNILKTLNLSFTPSKILTMYSKKEHDLTMKICQFFIPRALITWPLIFACSIHTKCHNDNFKVEYIIPQLIMQWCLENADIDGICYYSVRSKYNNSLGYSLFQENLALPAKVNIDNTICDSLKNKLKLSEPLLIKSFKYLKSQEISKKEFDLWALNNPPGLLNYYGRRFITKEKQPSIFERFEIKLFEHPVDHIK
jgi:hypothetical protein